MKQESLKNGFSDARKNVIKAYCLLTATTLTFAGSPAFAQLEKATSTAQTVITWAGGVFAIAIITLAFLYVGFKVMYQGRAISELWNVLLGAVIVGGAAGFATFAMSS